MDFFSLDSAPKEVFLLLKNSCPTDLQFRKKAVPKRQLGQSHLKGQAEISNKVLWPPQGVTNF